MRKHNKTFHIRFTDKEYEKLCAMSERTGLPKSTCIRFLIAGLVPKDRPSADYYAMTKQLYRIGNLLNQIAARAHATGHIDSKRLKEALALFRKGLLELQDTAVMPEPMDTKEIIRQATAVEEQDFTVWEVSNSKEGNP
ncbi:plasmid mobilization protein [Sinanaerobacter chloroacetimidivorans]|uniref:Plasmid mobilization relaxosome protein MobC n=1 Tax=Sinanaerobacter chloroacetimidivorans TaxID=2818044 RepID=A0A8J7VZ39_9FIRM|nr:plasmid mobilization relaxosome protein MobC [Sinanaerobacter chloroacetimidivorans]MBR0597797.1 plasmid mobilization relaxosome protein MobC [Sinanaerobacter chloroacetimidivorans]